MADPVYEPWSFIKQFAIKLRTYHKLFGFLWHLAIPAVIIVLILISINFVSSLFKKPIHNDNRQDIVAKDNSKIINNYITNENKRRLEMFGGLYGDVDGKGDHRIGAFGGGKY